MRDNRLRKQRDPVFGRLTLDHRVDDVPPYTDGDGEVARYMVAVRWRCNCSKVGRWLWGSSRLSRSHAEERAREYFERHVREAHTR